jgi:hypothetical protein
MEAKTYANIKGARAAAKKAGIDAELINIVEVQTNDGTRYAFAEGVTEEQADAPTPALTTLGKPAPAPKVEQEERNGVKRPKAGGVCAAVWAWMDANPAATLKEAKAAAPAHGWNPNNVSCEFYARRKFLGISGHAVAT